MTDTTLEPTVEAPPNEAEELALVALTPAEMPDQQRALAAWCDRKIDAVQRELATWRALEEEAVAGGFKHATYTRHASRTAQRVTYYEKIKAAIEAGYLIVPNMPVSLFAVRVDRAKPVAVESTSRWTANFAATAQRLPAGQGRYVDDDLPVYSRKQEVVKADGKTEISTIYFAKRYNEDIDFPLRGVHPRVLQATSQAMALKLFDELGVVRHEVGRDPIVVGRLRDPRGQGRMATFFIAWWLNTADL